MGCYFEIWLRGFAKDYLRSLVGKDIEAYHPHVTLVRPFKLNTSEEIVRTIVSDFCKSQSPIPFSLEGKGSFDPDIKYVPVSDSLLVFNDDLERLLTPLVEFASRLNDRKIFHSAVPVENLPPCPRIDQYMLRLTAIQDRRIWFSYDFVTQEQLTRVESLDKSRWHNTVSEFTKRYGLIPTKEGFRRVNGKS